jgi:hypothetical protein
MKDYVAQRTKIKARADDTEKITPGKTSYARRRIKQSRKMFRVLVLKAPDHIMNFVRVKKAKLSSLIPQVALITTFPVVLITRLFTLGPRVWPNHKSRASPVGFNYH